MKSSISLALTTASSLAQPRKFYSKPAPNDWLPFLNLVLQTGRPHTWEHHTHTKPPKDGDFVELVAFEIPTKFHTEEYLAPCPLCSPNVGKYYRGVLTWYPQEGVLRAIGIDCAASHFGDVKANGARNDRLMDERRNAVQDYLIEALPKLLTLRPEVLAIQRWAKDLDIAAKAISNKVTKAACKQFCRMWPDGELFAWQEIKTSRVNQFGNIEEHIERVRAPGGVRVAGFAFFKSVAAGSRKMQVLAEQTLIALDKMPGKTRFEALELVAEELKTDADLMAVNRLVTNAVTSCEQLTRLADDAQAFFSSDNLLRLSSWTGLYSNGSPIQFEFDRAKPDRLMVKSPGHPWERVEVPRFGIYRGPLKSATR